ncbi:hypothetical protein [Actinobacillus delphinicola]|uniref:Uncharacterized protein n=1 Tax=Actinobacillus delphinicola TaxID=51161 RepID=A0A448TRQ5_9PAST|nr:hypothetical protein [Actinobacillus delphinicola]VEJ08714.1 Uncharacterised protein [Actinobacillus delphinicola]
MNPFLNDLVKKRGFVKPMQFNYQGKAWNITLKFKARAQDTQITPKQEEAFDAFYNEKVHFEKLTEKLICDYIEHFQFEDTKVEPTTLLIDKEGMVALLCECAWDPEEGIAVVLLPKAYVTVQNEIL